MARFGTRTSPRFLPALALAAGLNACGSDAPPSRQADAEPAPEAPAAEEPAPAATAEKTNARPRIHSLRLEPERPTAGDAIRVVAEASDEDGDSVWLRYRWQLAGEPVEGAQKLLLQGTEKGDRVEVWVTATDGVDESETRYAATAVHNAPPRLERVRIEPASEIVGGSQIVVRPEARDPDGDAVSFRYEWTVNGRRVAEEGPVLSTRDLRRGDGVEVAVVATDGLDESEPVATPRLPVVNAPPRIVSQPGQPAEDGTFRYHVEAEDPDGDTGLQFSLEDAPAGMSIHPLSGDISWTPEPEQAGTHSVSVVVDDLQGGRRRQTFQVSVGEPEGEAPAKPGYP